MGGIRRPLCSRLSHGALGAPLGSPRTSRSPWAEEGLCELCWWLACSPTAEPEGLGMFVRLG